VIFLRIDLKTNLSFLLVLLSIIVLAFIEGISISRALIKEVFIQGSDVQLIAFIIIALFMIIISTLKPNKLILVSYSSMTLGLIVTITGLFDPTNKAPDYIKVTEAVVGLILIIGGFFMGRGLKINEKDKEIVKEGIKNYKRL